MDKTYEKLMPFQLLDLKNEKLKLEQIKHYLNKLMDQDVALPLSAMGHIDDLKNWCNQFDKDLIKYKAIRELNEHRIQTVRDICSAFVEHCFYYENPPLGPYVVREGVKAVPCYCRFTNQGPWFQRSGPLCDLTCDVIQGCCTKPSAEEHITRTQRPVVDFPRYLTLANDVVRNNPSKSISQLQQAFMDECKKLTESNGLSDLD